jgi:threonine/homoserine/homoserine lactone efflux protein
MTNVLPVLLRGLAIGFSIAAPVGPIGILCIRTTLLRGRAAGLAAGLGAATADGLYGLVAAGGLALLLHALVALETPLRLLGGGFLLYLGLAALRAAPPPPGDSGRTTEGGLLRAFLTTFLLTSATP